MRNPMKVLVMLSAVLLIGSLSAFAPKFKNPPKDLGTLGELKPPPKIKYDLQEPFWTIDASAILDCGYFFTPWFIVTKDNGETVTGPAFDTQTGEAQSFIVGSQGITNVMTRDIYASLVPGYTGDLLVNCSAIEFRAIGSGANFPPIYPGFKGRIQVAGSTDPCDCIFVDWDIATKTITLTPC